MSGRRILLAGSSGGIGTGLASAFPDDTLFLHYHLHEPSCKEKGHAVRADLTNYDEVERMIGDIQNTWGGVDVVVNAAGISIDGFAHKLTPEAWRSVIDTNLSGSFNLVRAVLPSMRANKYGRIILLTSVVFQSPVMGTLAYSASKAGLVGLVRTVDLENARMKITCNCVALGYFDAGMLYRIPEQLREQIRMKIPLERFGRIEELTKTVDYLINTEYITGQVISVNGGLYLG